LAIILAPELESQLRALKRRVIA